MHASATILLALQAASARRVQNKASAASPGASQATFDTTRVKESGLASCPYASQATGFYHNSNNLNTGPLSSMTDSRGRAVLSAGLVEA